MSTRRTALVALAAAGTLLLGACGSGADPVGTAEDDPEGRTLTVLAAASLTESFGELEALFEAAHEGVDVRISYDSSATLAQQAAAGAPADVLATADEASMQVAQEGGVLAADPQVFATNTLVLVTPVDNPAGIESIADLDGDVVYVVCVESAPCGALAARLLEENGIGNDPASEEVDVKAVLQKVSLDEADAGLVYATDAAAEDRVAELPVPGADDAPATYPIAPLSQAADPALAADWVELVTSAEGQEILAGYGFAPPANR